VTAAISVENLAKSYLVGHRAERDEMHSYTALRDVLGREIGNAVRKTIDVMRGRQIVPGELVEEFWALNGISFEVQEGEVLGIIGHNGAGKSTLLKVLSRITEPTRGRVTLRGRVASLLEVGTGFHPELTGRENIFLNGAILGMSRAEIRKKFDEIVAFAEVERFLDTPVKRYSSGMYVRLAFAVAAHLEPEILVVDEVLAVGDAEFQRKCLGKMDEVSRREGRTILVVSHNMGVITGLCSRALWLHRGVVRADGAAQAVVGQYIESLTPSRDRFVALDAVERPSFVRDDRFRFTALEWLSPLPLQNGEPVNLRLHFQTRGPMMSISAILGFTSIEGTRVLTYHMGLNDGARPDITAAGEHFIDLTVDVLNLGPALYYLDVVCRSGELHCLDYLDRCVQLEVAAGPRTPRAIAQNNGGVRLGVGWALESPGRVTGLAPVASGRELSEPGASYVR
jgi:lipopolysaccharide transport system ATP-binding protein